MKKFSIYFAATSFAFAAILLGSSTVSAQSRAGANDARAQTRVAAPSALVVENFDYPNATLLTTVGWTAHSGAGTNAIITTAPGLVYSGWPSSGNAASLTTSGEDAHRTFPARTAGSAYVGVLVNLSEATTDAIGGYFFHIGASPIGTTFRGRIFARKDGTNAVSFGFTKSSTSTAVDIAYTPFTYALNTTYLMIIKYTIVDGVTNDTASLFINPTLGGAEPAATLVATDIATTDINPGSFALRQGTAATHPTTRVDSIRVSSTWAELVTPAPAAAVDFNGDGKTDFATVRNTGGGPTGQITWFTSESGTGNTTGTAWGISGDFFVPVDYDGDGKTDVAVWRPGAPTVAAFYIFQSGTSTVRVDRFGQSGDDPRIVGDYDGDGKADAAVYRTGANAGDPSTWFYRGSLTPSIVNYVAWGQNADFLAPGDYDGDGKRDFVIQRNNGGGQAAFWFRQTTAGFAVIPFGTPADLIVPGDYDGDGKTDLAVVRGAGGQLNWYVRPSSTGTVSATPTAIFGNSATDFMTQGDYDGDGRTDISVWRPNADPTLNFFYYLGSTSGSGQFEWGQNGDYPVANYNRF